MKRIFIANRGEIAVRILRACREMENTAVVGYSDADRASLAVRLSDEAPNWRCAIERKLLEYSTHSRNQMRQSAMQFIPGYGFLAERAAFAEACEKAGIIFIGPRSEIIELMGEKTQARQAVKSAEHQ